MEDIKLRQEKVFDKEHLPLKTSGHICDYKCHGHDKTEHGFPGHKCNYTCEYNNFEKNYENKIKKQKYFDDEHLLKPEKLGLEIFRTDESLIETTEVKVLRTLIGQEKIIEKPVKDSLNINRFEIKDYNNMEIENSGLNNNFKIGQIINNEINSEKNIIIEPDFDFVNKEAQLIKEQETEVKTVEIPETDSIDFDEEEDKALRVFDAQNSKDVIIMTNKKDDILSLASDSNTCCLINNSCNSNIEIRSDYPITQTPVFKRIEKERIRRLKRTDCKRCFGTGIRTSKLTGREKRCEPCADLLNLCKNCLSIGYKFNKKGEKIWCNECDARLPL